MDKIFQYHLQKPDHRMNSFTFQFSDQGASTQFGCSAVTSNFSDKITISPVQTLCQFRLSFSIVLKYSILFKYSPIEENSNLCILLIIMH